MSTTATRRAPGRNGISPETPSGASPWAGLRSRFLDSRSPAEQVRIFDLSARAAQKLHRWSARYPLIRRVRVWPLALSVAAAAPFCTVEALISTARQSLWVFTLDDLFDEERVPHAELVRRAERFSAIARGTSRAPVGDSLAAALCEVRDDLSTYPLFKELGDVWAQSLCETIDAMMLEYQWRLSRESGEGGLPSYEDYVLTGRYSIGVPPHVWATVIASNDPSAVNHLGYLSAIEETASRCIRLANDLQSYQKEIREGKINALVILGQTARRDDPRVTEVQMFAEERVRADIALGLKAIDELQAESRTDTGRPEAAIADIARFVCDFYGEHDYHTFLAQGG